MARDQDDLFDVKMAPPKAERRRVSGRIGRGASSYQRQVFKAVGRAGGDVRHIGKPRTGKGARNGRYNAHGRGAKVMRVLPRDTGWKFDAASGQRLRMRRVVVKARYVKLKGVQSRAGYAHLHYLQRDGVSREGEPGRLYGRALEEPDGSAFLDRSAGDRHQFRLIVAPEDGIALGDLKGFTRELMEQMERDLDTRLDWLAVDHHNTGHPHTHIVIRGVTDDGKTLNIAGDYIAHGIRYRAGEILTRELGLQSEREVEQQLDLEVDQNRLTRLDRNLIAQAGAENAIDMRKDADELNLADAQRYRLLRRLKKLERMGLAKEFETGCWSLSPGMDKTLRDLGERGDIIKTMHRSLAERGIVRGVDRYAIHRGPDGERPIVGRVVSKGLSADEMSDRIHVIVDGVDGRVHYAEMTEASAEDVKIGSVVEVGRARAKPRESDRAIAEIARDSGGGVYEPGIHLTVVREMEHVPGGDPIEYVRAHVRRLEALRRAGVVERLDEQTWKIPSDFQQKAQDYDTQRSKQLGVRVLSLLDLDAQVATNGATWLDRELITNTPAPIHDDGFGREVCHALVRRQQWLIEQGLAQQKGDMILFRANLLATLARREVNEKGQELARERGGIFHMAQDGERITGLYRGAVQLASGKYAWVEQNSREFTLVPWRPVIEKELGRTVSGIMRGASITWQIGRSRGISIGF